MPYSVSKPYAAVCALVLVARGRLDLDASARRYWPQLRVDATVRQILSHSAGLVTLYRPAPTRAFFDWDDLCRRIAEQEPAWPPGEGVGESSLLYGHLVGELVRRVDGRSLGTFLREEVSGPLGLDFCVGVSDVDLGRVADLTGAVPGGLVDRCTRPRWPTRRERQTWPWSTPEPFAAPRCLRSMDTARRGPSLGCMSRSPTARCCRPTCSLNCGACRPPGSTRLSATTPVGAWVWASTTTAGGWAAWAGLGWFSERGQYAFAFVTGDLGGFERATALEECRARGARPARLVTTVVDAVPAPSRRVRRTTRSRRQRRRSAVRSSGASGTSSPRGDNRARKRRRDPAAVGTICPRKRPRAERTCSWPSRTVGGRTPGTRRRCLRPPGCGTACGSACQCRSARR